MTLTSRGREVRALSSPAGGALPDRGLCDAELLALPRGSDPRLLVPLERRAAAAAVQRYGVPGSRAARLGQHAIRLSMASGAGVHLFGGRLLVQARQDSPTISSYLRSELGCDIRLSINVGRPRANRKPVLQLLTPGGESIGFAKVGIDPLTCRLVRAEHRALMELADARPETFRVPSVVHFGNWNDLPVLVLDPLPVWLPRRPLSRSRLTDAMCEIASIAGVTRERLAAAAYWRRLEAQAHEVQGRPGGAQLASSLRTLVGRSGTAVLSYGSWHGDWTPWNMATTHTGLLVWDWERLDHGVPVGFDALHHWLSTEVNARGRRPSDAARELIGRAPGLLGPFSVDAANATLTALLYLAELSARYLRDRQSEAGARFGAPEEWLIPAIAEELARG